jgi:hypothetical protein
VRDYRSKVELLARTLRRLALVLLVLWVLAAIAAIVWVSDELGDEASAGRYIMAVADVGSFLIASVVAYVGSALVQTLGRIRGSIIQAIYERTVTEHVEEPLSQ